MRLFRKTWSIARSHRAITALSGLLILSFLALGVLIGMPPFGFVVIIVCIATPCVVFLVRATSDGSQVATMKFVGVLIAATVVTLVAIQLVPYGNAHTNPSVTGEPQWANAETRDLMVRACFGCHSNEVEYPAYASVAPISWVVQSHIDEGRKKVNYSEFDRRQRGADETLEVIQKGEMPPHYYTLFGLHPEAKLSRSEIDTLIAGITATPGLAEHDD